MALNSLTELTTRAILGRDALEKAVAELSGKEARRLLVDAVMQVEQDTNDLT